MKLLVTDHRFAYEMENVLRLFYRGQKIDVVTEGDPGDGDTFTAQAEIQPDGSIRLYARVPQFHDENTRNAVLPAGTPDAETEWALARLLFELLQNITGVRPPWGTLTGVRPARLCRAMGLAGMSDAEIRQTLSQRSLVSPEKIDLAMQIVQVQRPLLQKIPPGSFSLYISIPFCPSRCLYCSFISHDINGMAALIPGYLRCLQQELRYTGAVVQRLGLRLSTIYIGGGTPTTLTPGQLQELMQAVRDSFDFSHLLEYTIEAGRPDTITAEKLMVMRKMGADRISVNPQTMNDDVLRGIGRGHSAQDTRDAYRLVREAGFAHINMDLIAGLPGDTQKSFYETLGELADFHPQNITLHTLTVKRSSRLRENPQALIAGSEDISEQLDFAGKMFSSMGYHPYYLYRQKGTVQNLENIGWTLRGHEGLYNVLTMEELQTILAVGAGAVTKILRPHQGLQRIFNYKFPQEYISGFEEMLRRKDEAEGVLAASNHMP